MTPGARLRPRSFVPKAAVDNDVTHAYFEQDLLPDSTFDAGDGCDGSFLIPCEYIFERTFMRP